MRILMMRINETVRVGDDISITFARIAGTQVSLHIQAPNSVAIVCAEICKLLADGVQPEVPMRPKSPPKCTVGSLSGSRR